MIESFSTITAMGWAALPQSGELMQPLGSISVVNGAFSSGQLNLMHMHPILIEKDWNFAAAGINISTAAVGGAGVGFRCGLYRDNGYGSGPLVGDTPFRDFGIASSSAVGFQPAANVPGVIPAGLYWSAVQGTYTSAPSTMPSLTLNAAGSTLALQVSTSAGEYAGMSFPAAYAFGAIPSSGGTLIANAWALILQGA